MNDQTKIFQVHGLSARQAEVFVALAVQYGKPYFVTDAPGDGVPPKS